MTESLVSSRQDEVPSGVPSYEHDWRVLSVITLVGMFASGAQSLILDEAEYRLSDDVGTRG